MEFIIIDTWNGDGYSDSTAKIETFVNENQALKECLENALSSAGDEPQRDINIRANGVGYSLLYGEQNEQGQFEDENNGAYYFEKYTGQYAVIINPMVNEYRIIETKAEFEKQVEQWKQQAWDAYEVNYLNEENFDECFCSLEDGDVIIKLLERPFGEDTLEFFDGGDGVEFEIWKDKATDKQYRVPIEIVRDFDNATEINN